MKLHIFSLALSTALGLCSCSDDPASPAAPSAPTTLSGSFGSVARGAWRVDTTLKIDGGILGPLTPKLIIRDTILADSTFSGAVYLENVYQGNSVAGALYTRSGRWVAPGDSLFILNPDRCLQSDTATQMGKSIPFNFLTFKANALKAVPCSTPDTVRTRPLSNGHWSVPMVVNMPGIAVGTWILDFFRQP